MHKITIKAKRCLFSYTLNRQVPSCWAEVTKKQLVNSIKYLLEGNQSGVFCELAHIQPRTLKYISPEDAYELVQLVNFTKNAPTRFFIESIDNRISIQDTLKNISIGQMAFADSYFLAFIVNQKEETLNNLIACLYGYKMSSKKYFWLKEMAEDHRFLKKLSYAEKLSIFFCYKGARDAFIGQFPKLFKQPITELEQEAKPQSVNPLHLFELTEQLSKTLQYGSYETTFYTTAEQIFFNLEISK